jgi:hypothetical protein
MLLVVGCASSDLLVGNLRLKTVEDAPAVAKPALPQIRSATKDEKVIIKPAASVAEYTTPETSEWCRYIAEDTAAQATILRSPSLSGSVNDGGRTSLSLGLSASSFNKARLIETAAGLRCRQHLAETGLQKLIFISPQGLTSAGFRAKSLAIARKRGDLERLRKQAKAELRAGNLTAERATSIAVLIDQIVADGNEAKSQADRRLADGLAAPQAAKALGQELLRAEAELEDLNSALRTTENMDVSVSAGWNDDLNNGWQANSDSFSGKVSFSIKLGAVAPQRFRHERLAKEAKLNAIASQEGGVLWQVGLLRRAHERALQGLEESRRKLGAAILEADRLVATMRTISDPEFSGVSIAAKVQAVRLQAERAAVEGSIAEIHENIARLKLG